MILETLLAAAYFDSCTCCSCGGGGQVGCVTALRNNILVTVFT